MAHQPVIVAAAPIHIFQWNNKTTENDFDEWTQLFWLLWWRWHGNNSCSIDDEWELKAAEQLFCSHVNDRLNLYYPSIFFSRESAAKTQKEKERGGRFKTGLCHMRLTQALAHGHAVLLWVEIVAVAGTAPVYEAHTLPLAHVEVPAGHGGTAGAGLSLQGAHRCQGTAR